MFLILRSPCIFKRVAIVCSCNCLQLLHYRSSFSSTVTIKKSLPIYCFMYLHESHFLRFRYHLQKLLLKIKIFDLNNN